MDVAGFPSRENVCSNILAFYLNPAAEHGLGDLLLTISVQDVSTEATGHSFNRSGPHPARIRNG